MNELLTLLLNCANDFRMTVSRRTNCDSGIAIEESVTVDVFHPDALGALGDNLKAGRG